MTATGGNTSQVQQHKSSPNSSGSKACGHNKLSVLGTDQICAAATGKKDMQIINNMHDRIAIISTAYSERAASKIKIDPCGGGDIPRHQSAPTKHAPTPHVLEPPSPPRQHSSPAGDPPRKGGAYMLAVRSAAWRARTFCSMVEVGVIGGATPGGLRWHRRRAWKAASERPTTSA